MSGTLNVIFIDGLFPDYYELLNVARHASERDIIIAYRKAALNQHPDKAGDSPKQNETFSHINNAKDVLADDEKRQQYAVLLLKHECTTQRFKRQQQYHENTPTPDPAPTRPTWSPRNPRPGAGSTKWRQPPPPKQPPYYSHPSFNPVRPGVAFHRFFAPLSAYSATSTRCGMQPHQESFWFKFERGHTSLGQMHMTACNNALLVCLAASDIEGTIVDIEQAALLHVNLPPTSNDPNNLHSRLSCGIELVVELMHFVAESYNHHKNRLDNTTYIPPKAAWVVVEEERTLFDKLEVIISSTRGCLFLLPSLLLSRNQSVGFILPKLLAILKEWDDFCELPYNLMFGIQDTFNIPPDKWTNSWQRKREASIFGYQNERFLLKADGSIGAQRAGHEYQEYSPRQPKQTPHQKTDQSQDNHFKE